MQLLDGWSGSLTWEDLCTCMATIGFKLPDKPYANLIVAGAYKLAKEREKNNAQDIKIPATWWSYTTNRTYSWFSGLRKENTALLEQFVVWQYNAFYMEVSREN